MSECMCVYIRRSLEKGFNEFTIIIVIFLFCYGCLEANIMI